MKKFISILSAVSIAAAMLPCCVSAAESGTCGENITWSLDDNGTLTISGTGAMEDYDKPEFNIQPAKSSNQIPWKYLHYNIKSIVIEEGVTSICDYAFYSCYNAVSVNIPESVTSIGKSAFELCEELTFVSLPDSITYIGDGAFAECTNLIGVTLPKNLTSIEDSLFEFCTSLLSVDIPETVTYIGDSAFSCCNKLNSITLPQGITEINYSTFECCTNLTSINIPDSVTRIDDYAFSECSFTSVTIPESVTYIGNGALRWCYELSEINYPETAELGFGAFGSTAFERNLPKDEYGVTYFNNRLVANEVDISGEYTVRYGTTALEGDAFWSNCNLKSVILPDTVEYIGGFAFGMCKKLENIHIPDSVTEIEIYAFKGCESLENIYIPASVTRIGKHAFDNCINLKDIYFEGSEEQWNEITSEFIGFDGTENAKRHFNCEPQQNAYTASMALEEYLPEGVTAVKGESGTSFSLTTDSAKLITTHYQGNRLVDVNAVIPANGIAEIDIASDTDDVKIWSCEDGFEIVFEIDADYLNVILENLN